MKAIIEKITNEDISLSLVSENEEEKEVLKKIHIILYVKGKKLAIEFADQPHYKKIGLSAVKI